MVTEHSAEITQAISRFEAAWARGESPQLDAFIPEGGEGNIELVSELMAVDLEWRLKSGEDFRVEMYLESFPGLEASPGDLVNLIVSEYELRCRRSPTLGIDEYLQRFPQYEAWLKARLSRVRDEHISRVPFAKNQTMPQSDEPGDSTAAGMLKQLVKRGIVAGKTIKRCQNGLSAKARRQPQSVIDVLRHKGYVTDWQLKQLRAGQKTFVLDNGRYLLLDELGKGGMGTVYRARHIGLKRDVALKTIDPHQTNNKQLIGRFQREIALCAKLQHEHIVQAYDMGCHDSVHFLVLEYVEGADLASLVKRNGPLAPAEVANVGLQIAAALVYAHAQGIVHRDIKPHNILLSTDGVSKLLDLGLARIDSDEESESVSSLTQTGLILGTADYMPPEQATDLSKVDVRSDIYSLGATLYYLLTGQPPFPGGDMISKMHRLANEEPARINKLRADCPRKLSEIVSRMLAKRPERRYQSAEDVVRAFEPLVADSTSGCRGATQPVRNVQETKRATLVEPVLAVLREHPKQKSLLIGSAIGALLLLGVVLWGLTREGGQPIESIGLATLTERVDELTRRITNSTPNPDDSHVVELRIQLVDFHTQHLGTPEGIAVARQMSRVPWPVDRLQGQEIKSDNAIVGAIGHSPQVVAELVATAGGEQHEQQSRVNTIAVKPDGRSIVSGSADHTVKVWDAGTGSEERTLHGHTDWVRSVSFSPNGRLIASGSDDKTVKLWNTASGDELLTLQGHEGSVWSVAFSPDGQRIATGSWDNTVKVWDAIDGTEILTLQGHTDYVLCVAFSPDGQRIASCGDDKTVRVWSSTTSEKEIELRGHDHSVWSVTFSPDGKRIVSGSQGGTIMVWDAESGTQELVLRGETDDVRSVAFSPDGRLFAATGESGAVILRHPEQRFGSRLKALRIGSASSTNHCVAFTPDGRHLVAGNGNGTVYVLRLKEWSGN